MHKRQLAFTLTELLVVIAVIGILAGITIPAVYKVRERAQIVKSTSNMRQIYIAFSAYLNDNEDKMFWRADDPGNDGMEWYVHGGRETNNANTGQSGIFNRISPRPLNSYVGNHTDIFKHPSDVLPNVGGVTHFESVGNDYAFNAMGYPGVWDTGLAGVYLSNIREPGRTIVFIESHLVKPNLKWAGGDKGNICLADGRIVWTTLPQYTGGQFLWGSE
ncbi:MAG: type II secretion system protein [Verrucomicrobiota bacterium]|nr:type II secretion system protein [Verrucomicrobiota bacterium]